MTMDIRLIVPTAYENQVMGSAGTRERRLPTGRDGRHRHLYLSLRFMLRIGSIRWRGKCPKHPLFDPYFEGRGAVAGSCERCALLADIEAHHRQMLALMRRFAPPKPDPRRPHAKSDLQIELFEEY
jgi:hypothetical protein